MLHLLKRHPLPISALLSRSLVLTYAFPTGILAPLLPEGLVVDLFAGYALLAIALVQARRLRPCFLPAVAGRDLFLGGYRIFARLASAAGSKRGLFVLGSLTNRRWMVGAGNRLTHYQYRLCESTLVDRDGRLQWTVRSADAEADLEVTADLSHPALVPPEGSVFSTLAEARRFAGPLPYTFDYEQATGSIISIHALRQSWHPQPVRVTVGRNRFLEREPFCRAAPLLANAFYLRDVPYHWQRGVRLA
jgi:Uncharacterized conserved protein (COG2071)